MCNSKNNIVTYNYGSAVHASDIVALSHVDTMKDLGVMVDNELQFTAHVYDKINLAYKMLGIIKRNFIDLGVNSFLILYKGFVRCHIEFANSVWNPYKLGVIKDLEKVQKRATKCIKGFSRISYSDRLKKLNLPTLKYRRLRGDMIEVYKILSSLYTPDIAPELAKNVNSVTRGNNLKLLVRRSRLDLRKFSFCE